MFDVLAGIQNLRTMSAVLEREGEHEEAAYPPTRWWLEAGTCLGLHRDSDFIQHDSDLDFGILEEDFNWLLIERLTLRGFRIHNVYGSRHRGLEISLKRHKQKVDIFLFYKHGDIRWHAA